MKAKQEGTRRERRQARLDMYARFFENSRIPPRFHFEPQEAIYDATGTLYLWLRNGMLIRVKDERQLKDWEELYRARQRGPAR